MSYVDSSKLPLGEFIKAHFETCLPQGAIEDTLKVQAMLMVLDYHLRLNESRKTDKTPEEKKKARTDFLFKCVSKPEGLEETIRNYTKIYTVRINQEIETALGILRKGKGPGEGFEAVPVYGALLIHKNLGYVSTEVKNAAMIAQQALRLAALGNGHAKGTDYAAPRFDPSDSSELRCAARTFRDLQIIDKEGRLDNGMKEVARYGAGSHLALAKQAFTKIGKAVGVIDALIEITNSPTDFDDPPELVRPHQERILGIVNKLRTLSQ